MALGLEPKCHCARKEPAVGNSIKPPRRRRPRRSLCVSSWVQAQPALLLPPLRTNHRSVSEHRRKPLPQRRSAVNSNFASTRNVSQRSSRYHNGADCVDFRATAVARGLRPPFRLFPWHVGALNACRAFNFAAAPWKFARKLAARPTASAERGQKKRRFCAS